MEVEIVDFGERGRLTGGTDEFDVGEWKRRGDNNRIIGRFAFACANEVFRTNLGDRFDLMR